MSGADNDGDGRCVVAGDFRHNGQLDVVVRQAGGGPVHLYENHFPRRHYLEVSLRGTMKEYEPGRRSNRLGIGARLVAVVNGQPLVREMYPLNSFHSQMPNVVHFGLGDADRVEKLTILWPSGLQAGADRPGGRPARLVEEGSDAVETVRPGGRRPDWGRSRRSGLGKATTLEQAGRRGQANTSPHLAIGFCPVGQASRLPNGRRDACPTEPGNGPQDGLPDGA